MSWSVGKNVVGGGGLSQFYSDLSEDQAKETLARIMRNELNMYEAMMRQDDPNGWYGPLLRLMHMVEALEQGKWPYSDHGLHWVWSLPWNPERWADRDLCVFWARFEGGQVEGDNVMGVEAARGVAA